MKRFLCLCLCALMVFQLFGCGNSQPEVTTEASNSAKEDGVLTILMVASSFSYYYPDELYGMLEAAGIKARVCNMYESGCSLQMLYDHMMANETPFKLIIHDENGKTEIEGVGFDQCLQYADWDLVSMQDGSFNFRVKPGLSNLDMNRSNITAIIDRIHEKAPNADVYLQHIWAYDIGFNQNGFTMNSTEEQLAMADRIREFTLAACKEFNMSRVPSGEAWIIARENLPADHRLCARLSVNNGEGDYYHEGDIGGGQYLNACVWFETLTGESCIGNTFRPTYTHNGAKHTLSEELITVLQNAAHQAVADMRAGE